MPSYESGLDSDQISDALHSPGPEVEHADVTVVDEHENLFSVMRAPVHHEEGVWELNIEHGKVRVDIPDVEMLVHRDRGHVG